MSHVNVSSVVQRMAAYSATSGSSTVPECEALWFYGMNHGMALIAQRFDPLEPLPKEELTFVQLYHQKMAEKAARAFYYLLIICTREARHCSNLSEMKPALESQFGYAMAGFMAKGGGESGIHEKLKNHPPATMIGNYVKCLQWMFYNCKWPGGYGGPAWGKVTDCLVNFVTGTFSAEMMLDTIWTLCHNNGPIFNKGHLYSTYGSHIVRMLDIQRSGQIPTAVLTDAYLVSYVDDDLRDLMKRLVEKYDLPKYVDWYTVEALGSVKKYKDDKKAQAAKYGVPETAAEAEKQAAALAAAAAAKAAKEAEEYKKNHLEIFPGFTVKKIKRAA